MTSTNTAFKYHERSISRTRTLYRIPTTPNDCRVLELYHNQNPILADYQWPRGSKNIFRVGTNISPPLHNATTEESHRLPFNLHHTDKLPFPDNAYDLIILHHTLDDLAYSAKLSGTKFDISAFLDLVAKKLVPNGLIAGCIHNRLSKKNIFRIINKILLVPDNQPTHPPLSLRDLIKLLSNDRFDDVHIYNLLPHSDNPLRLIDVTPNISKIAFRHEIEYARSTYSQLGYFVRRIAVEIGLYPHIEESLFFWAHRRC